MFWGLVGLIDWGTHRLQIIPNIGDLCFDDSNVLTHFTDDFATGDVVIDLAFDVLETLIHRGDMR